MNFERFIRERFEAGTHDSEGQFTVDLRKASDKVAAFALPSDSHYLLKVVQVAHRLRTDEIRVDIVLPPDPDSHDAPDNPQAADGDLLNREAAIETAQALGAWLARHTRSLTSHHAARLQHLFIG